MNLTILSVSLVTISPSITVCFQVTVYLCGLCSLRSARVRDRDGLFDLPVILVAVAGDGLDAEDAKLGEFRLEGGDVEVLWQPRHQDARRRWCAERQIRGTVSLVIMEAQMF